VHSPYGISLSPDLVFYFKEEGGFTHSGGTGYQYVHGIQDVIFEIYDLKAMVVKKI
jgi:hypothetical protein